jgi:hypothetical protein
MLPKDKACRVRGEDSPGRKPRDLFALGTDCHSAGWGIYNGRDIRRYVDAREGSLEFMGIHCVLLVAMLK